MRQRINRQRLCSSENYEVSRKLHIEQVREFHEEHIVEIEKYTLEEKKRYYVSIFGNLVEISETEALRIKDSVRIVIL